MLYPIELRVRAESVSALTNTLGEVYPPRRRATSHSATLASFLDDVRIRELRWRIFANRQVVRKVVRTGSLTAQVSERARYGGPLFHDDSTGRSRLCQSSTVPS